MEISMQYELSEKLKKASEKSGLSRGTIINLAFYEGLRSLSLGYIPDIKEKTKGKIEKIEVPVTKRMDELLKEYAFLINCPKKDLKEALIESMVERINREFDSYNEEGRNEKTDKTVKATFKISISKYIADVIKQEAEVMEIKLEQYYKYLLLEGFWSHFHNQYPLTMDKDRVISEIIKRMNLDPVKTTSLVEYLAKNRFSNDVDSDRILELWTKIE